MAIFDFFVSRNGSTVNGANYVGHLGRLFYDSANGVIRLSDGVTPGGLPIPYTIASSTVVGGIKAGPGVVIAGDGTLTINAAGLPVSLGNLYVTDNILSSVNSNADVVLASNGTGNVELVGNIQFFSTSQTHNGSPFFKARGDGQVTIYTPVSDPTASAVRIIGSLTGNVFSPVNTGVMLHVVGNNNDASRIYNDGLGSFAAFVGRRLNGTTGSPTAVQAGDEIIRISSTGHNGTTIPGSGSARILYQAMENYTPSAVGTNISIWTTAVGSNVLTKTATFDSANGIVVSKATVTGNLTVSGNIIGNATTTTATIGTANVATLNVSGASTLTGLVTTTDGTNIGGDLTVSGNIKYNGSSHNFTVTQGVGADKSVAVTGHGRTGQITTNNSSLAKGAAVTFTLTNNYITSAKDVGVICIASGATPNSYAIAVTKIDPVAHQANITITNNGVGALTDTLVLNFALILVI